MPRKPFVAPRRFPKRIRKKVEDSTVEKQNLKFYHNFKSTLILLAIIAIMVVISIPIMDLLNPDRTPYPHLPKHREMLGKVKDFGTGLNSMLLEACYNRNWYSATPLQVDTSFSIESLQQLADDLQVPCNVRQWTESRDYVGKVSSGLAFPKSASDSLMELYGYEARMIFELSAMLNWMVMDGYIVHEGERISMSAHVRTYKKFYPKMARRINRNLDKLGIDMILDTKYPGDPEIIAKRCWEIDEAIENYIYPKEKEEDPTLIRI